MKRFLVMVAALFLPAVASGQYLWCWDQDEVWAEVLGEQVFIHHDAAVYNCCCGPFQYHVMWDSGDLVVLEEEVPPSCWCICCFDVTVVLDDLPPGPLTILFQWEDGESGELQEVELTVDMPSSIEPDDDLPDKAGVQDVFQTSCLSYPAPVPDEPDPRSRNWGTIKAWYR